MEPFWFLTAFVMVMHRNIRWAGWSEIKITGAGT
jgi:hypothetical protein